MNKARRCGTGSCLRGKYIGVKVRGQAPTSVTVNYSKLILIPYHKPLDPMMDLYDGQKIDLKTRMEYMDKDGCDSSRIRFFWYFTKITLRWNVVQSWIVDIFELYGLWCYQEESY